MVWTFSATRHNGNADCGRMTIRDDSNQASIEQDYYRRKMKRRTKAAAQIEATARPLYDAGACDREIAAACKCGASTVRRWRMREGLEANFVGRRRKT
jgi:Homeodomain-like domain